MSFHLCIVAGGLGSRLAPETNYIPKFLINIGKQTGYVEQLRYWQNQRPESITVIVHSRYAELTRAYHDLYYKDVPLIVKTVDEANGSAHAILTACDHLEGKRALFSWCDIIPGDHLPATVLRSDKTVIFTYDGACRYGLRHHEDGTVEPLLLDTPTGGVVGLYLVPRFSTKATFTAGQDFIDIIGQYGQAIEHKLEKLIDFGDKEKLTNVRRSCDGAREFNAIESIGEHLLLKRATTKQGKVLAKREAGWYVKLGELDPTCTWTPRAWIGTDGESLMLEKLDARPVWQAWQELEPKLRALVLKQVLVGGQQLHDFDAREVPRSILLRDVLAEARNKLLSRFAEIERLIEAFGPVSVVNGTKLTRTPRQAIEDVSELLRSFYSDCQPIYGFIHGDLQFSNSLLDSDNVVHIIDPRGYFGKSELSGHRDYDLGKLLYALHGYDLFNYSEEFGISVLQDGILEFSWPTQPWDGVEELMARTFKKQHQAWLVVNVLGLAQYIKNNPVKAACAHYHGLALAEKLLGPAR